MLTDAQLQSFKTRLTKEQAILQEELARMGTRNPNNPSDWEPMAVAGEFGADRNDNADIIETLHENNAAMNELEVRLKGVNEALARIEDGTYGICEVSQEEIEMGRLEANPAARTCIAHMEVTPS